MSDKEQTKEGPSLLVWVGLVIGFVGLTVFFVWLQGRKAAKAPSPRVSKRSPKPSLRREAKPVAPLPVRPKPLPTCNGWEMLCGRSYRRISSLTAHLAVEGKKARRKHQALPLSKLLTYGVRALHLSVKMYKGQVHICRGSCRRSSRHLGPVLLELKRWLETHPREVVTLLLSGPLPPKELARVFSETVLDTHVYTHPPGTPWPTLGRLIQLQKRLVVFSLKGGEEPPWNHSFARVGWATSMKVRSRRAWSCQPAMGDPGKTFFLLNHFLVRGDPLRNAKQTNTETLLIDRTVRCKAESGKTPNFVMIDHAHIGVGKEAVRRLNDGG